MIAMSDFTSVCPCDCPFMSLTWNKGSEGDLECIFFNNNTYRATFLLTSGIGTTIRTLRSTETLTVAVGG